MEKGLAVQVVEAQKKGEKTRDRKEKSGERERRRRKMEVYIEPDSPRFDCFRKRCLQLEQELKELEKAVISDYKQRHWLLGIRLFVCPPIHSSNPDSQTIANLDLRRGLLEATYLGASEAASVFDRVTHVLVYHRTGQEIPQKNILRSLGGQAEQDMVKFSLFLSSTVHKISVVYHDWLEDSLKARRILPVTEYLALS